MVAFLVPGREVVGVSRGRVGQKKKSCVFSDLETWGACIRHEAHNSCSAIDSMGPPPRERRAAGKCVRFAAAVLLP